MKVIYKLIILIGYKELHFDFQYPRDMYNFIHTFYSNLIVDEEDGKEVKMNIVVVPSSTDKPDSIEDESEDNE